MNGVVLIRKISKQSCTIDANLAEQNDFFTDGVILLRKISYLSCMIYANSLEWNANSPEQEGLWGMISIPQAFQSSQVFYVKFLLQQVCIMDRHAKLACSSDYSGHGLSIRIYSIWSGRIWLACDNQHV